MNVNIKLHCEHCGASIQAPREMAGRMSKCPACGNSVYVPTPENEIEELPLAPEDVSDLRKEAQLQAERRKLDTLLAREQAAGIGAEEGRSSGRAGAELTGAGRSGGRAGVGDGAPSGGSRTEAALNRYLAAMRDSDFETAERAIATLKLQPRTTQELIDRLAADPVPPLEMAAVPPGVFQGFLKNLRSRL